MTPLPFVAEILGPDILVILVIVALLFGSTRLPKLARSLGSAKSEFEKGLADANRPLHDREPDGTGPQVAETITLTRAELEAMIADRETKGRSNAGPSSPQLPAG